MPEGTPSTETQKDPGSKQNTRERPDHGGDDRCLRTVTTVVIGQIEDIRDMSPVETIDLLINATSARPSFMGRMIAILSRRGLIRHAKVLDLNYGKRALSRETRLDGLGYVDGLYMLCAQAVESLRIWTGIKSDPAEILRYLRRTTRKR